MNVEILHLRVVSCTNWHGDLAGLLVKREVPQRIAFHRRKYEGLGDEHLSTCGESSIVTMGGKVKLLQRKRKPRREGT
jgi:hypothetical protein